MSLRKLLKQSLDEGIVTYHAGEDLLLGVLIWEMLLVRIGKGYIAPALRTKDQGKPAESLTARISRSKERGNWKESLLTRRPDQPHSLGGWPVEVVSS
jgi:hypothetical protein